MEGRMVTFSMGGLDKGQMQETNKDRVYKHNLIICVFIFCMQHLGVFCKVEATL